MAAAGGGSWLCPEVEFHVRGNYVFILPGTKEREGHLAAPPATYTSLWYPVGPWRSSLTKQSGRASQLLSPASPFFHHLGSLSSNENQLILNLPLCLLLNNSGWKSLQPLSLSPSTALSSLSQLISQNNSNEWVHPFPLFPSHPLQTLIPEERASEESLAMRPGQP